MRFDQNKMYDVKNCYGDALVELAKENDKIVVVEADLMKASGSGPFKKAFPGRHFNVGIAEQNLLGFSAGLASAGKIPFASTFACFISQRACDQAMNAVAYNQFNVKMIGTYAGLTSEKNGGTHIGVEDLSIFRGMPGVVVIDPADAREFALSLAYAAGHLGPVYIRANKGAFPLLFDENHRVEEGKAVVLSEGGDVSLITTGIATQQGVLAAKMLAQSGISVRHVHMPFVKPIDVEAVVECADRTGAVVAVENHSIYGGLGSAVAEVLCEHRPARLCRMGFQDRFGETANLEYLLKAMGIDAGHIADGVRRWVCGETE